MKRDLRIVFAVKYETRYGEEVKKIVALDAVDAIRIAKEANEKFSYIKILQVTNEGDVWVEV